MRPKIENFRPKEDSLTKIVATTKENCQFIRQTCGTEVE